MLMQFQEFDRSYMDRLRSGDSQTEVHFVSYFRELIRMKAVKRLGSSAAVEDVQQETLTRVLRIVQENRIQQPDRLGAFVNTVCNNVMREYTRSFCHEVPAPDELADIVPDPAMSTADVIAQRQMQAEVQRILGGLAERDRAVMKALFLEERDKDEVCREFGVTREYLRVLVHRAKQAFKAHYLKAERERQSRISARRSNVRTAAFQVPAHSILSERGTCIGVRRSVAGFTHPRAANEN
jgi:RNA polymerase sigma-70 factor (ECF subfamily)